MNPAGISHESQLADRAKPYFFTPQSMRTFSSRISDYKPVAVDKHKSLLVIVSSKYGYEGATRHYEIVSVCPYGEVKRYYSDDSASEPIIKYESLKKARNSAQWNCRIEWDSCQCHGCLLNKQGR